MHSDADHAVFAPRLLARVLGAQYVAGGLIALVAADALASEPSGRTVILVLGGLACTLGALMGALSLAPLSARSTMRACNLCIFSAQCVIAGAFAAAQDPGSPLVLFMLWTTPFAGVLSRGWRWVHVVTTSVVLTAATLSMPAADPRDAAVHLVITLGTVVVVTLLVSRMTDRLHHAATHDALTGLPNRRLFAAAASQALRRRASHGGTVAVLLLDLDRFKHVNDTYGHSMGDALLRHVAPRLQDAVGKRDVVARLGGDEFALLCERPGDAVDLGAMLHGLSELARSQALVDGRRLYVSGSIGVAVARDDDTPETLLRDADAAMYEAKAAGGNRWRVFDPRATQRGERLLELEQGLREAVRLGRLEMHYQPIVDLQGGGVVGVEALMRWHSAELGAVGPDEFIAVAEQSGLIEEIGDWALDQSLRDLARWHRSEEVPADLHVAVNVSAHQLSPDFPGRVRQLLARHAVPPSLLGLEITESAMMAEDVSGEVLRALHELGVVLLLDDFGTGHSSLSNLRRYPLDVVKVDRAFVSRMCEDADDAAVVSGVLSLASALGKRVVAEGIETAEQLAWLRESDCCLGQGYLFSPAVRAREVPGVVRRLTEAAHGGGTQVKPDQGERLAGVGPV